MVLKPTPSVSCGFFVAPRRRVGGAISQPTVFKINTVSLNHEMGAPAQMVRTAGAPSSALRSHYNIARNAPLFGAKDYFGGFMIQRFTRTMLIAVAAAGLGAAGPGVAAADEHGHGHPRFAADVDAFHALLAPIWHARPGKARSRDACAKATEMARRAGEIRSADAAGLQASLSRLKATCQAAPDKVDAAFFDVHEGGKMCYEGRTYQQDIEAWLKAQELLLAPIRAEVERLKKSRKKRWNPRLVYCLG